MTGADAAAAEPRRLRTNEEICQAGLRRAAALPPASSETLRRAARLMSAALQEDSRREAGLRDEGLGHGGGRARSVKPHQDETRNEDRPRRL
jgi:hypothetical protein